MKHFEQPWLDKYWNTKLNFQNSKTQLEEISKTKLVKLEETLK